MEGKTLCGIGVVYSLLGQYSEALQHYNHSLIISRQVGHLSNEAATLSNTGLIYERLGQHLKKP